jgi:ribulose bisphosphate carboxylase small subunit
MLYNTFSSQKKVTYHQRNINTVITRYNKQERSMTISITDDWQAKTRSAPAMALYARRAAEDWQTQVRGVLADEYEIYEEYTTDPTPLTFDEWLNR